MTVGDAKPMCSEPPARSPAAKGHDIGPPCSVKQRWSFTPPLEANFPGKPPVHRDGSPPGDLGLSNCSLGG